MPGSPSSRQCRDVQGDPASLSSSEDDEDPRPKMAAAFVKAVWPAIENDQRQSVAELKETIHDVSMRLSEADVDLEI